MIPDKESWCDSVIPIVILEAIDVIRNQLRTPRIMVPGKRGKTAKSPDKSPIFNVYGSISLNKISNTSFLRCIVSKTGQNANHFESFCHTFT